MTEVNGIPLPGDLIRGAANHQQVASTTGTIVNNNQSTLRKS
jgi:hypothetical protein